MAEDDPKKYLALPHHAAVEHLKGLVPTLVTVDELDPLKHEGWSIYRDMQFETMKT